jgi:hypothetical protein
MQHKHQVKGRQEDKGIQCHEAERDAETGEAERAVDKQCQVEHRLFRDSLYLKEQHAKHDRHCQQGEGHG